MSDKFSATWVSHSSIKDFLNCPRAYYLNNVYRDPDSNHKIQIISAPLALGSAVHEVVESLSVLATKDRFKENLLQKFERVWKKHSGKKGGFSSETQEEQYKKRGKEMLQRVIKNPGPVAELAVKIKQDLPHYWLSSNDNIILCGKIDWLEYLPDTDSVNIIDFKTSKREEEGESLQLPIYNLLASNTQKRKVNKAYYWYLGLSDNLVEKDLPDLEKAYEQILQIAKKIKLQRQLKVFKCPSREGGCRYCKPLERVIRGEAQKVGVSEYNQDVYILPFENKEEQESEIL
ncbi:MAG: PD-(D/E)XK nuclease family protein [Patescibacteria group bacterium]